MTPDTYITLAHATSLFPRRRGRKISTATLRRRIAKGVSGVRLRAIRDGKQWFTTAEWVRRFQHELTEVSLPGPAHKDASDEQYMAAVENLKTRWGMKWSANTATSHQSDEGFVTPTTSQRGGESATDGSHGSE
tara:strand:+ start:41 stop:442 length:402 start_codon:yes stop_codon:yes gene_type:complete